LGTPLIKSPAVPPTISMSPVAPPGILLDEGNDGSCIRESYTVIVQLLWVRFVRDNRGDAGHIWFLFWGRVESLGIGDKSPGWSVPPVGD
jgi:hypothetical protein